MKFISLLRRLLSPTIRIVRDNELSIKRKGWFLAFIYILAITAIIGAIIYKWHLEGIKNDANPMIQNLKRDFPVIQNHD